MVNRYVHIMDSSDTRDRIVRAVRDLHEEVGPASTTISGVARRAGVQRLTVYRHFPDQGALIGACSSDWSEDHPLPSPALWTGLEEPRERLAAALTALYAYFRGGAAMLEQVLRDEAEVRELGEVMAPWWNAMREIAGGLAAGWGTRPEGQRHLRAAVGHALRFATWRSLTGEGLDDEEAVDMMVRWIEGLAEELRGERP
jgi:AcrR family transcriptional regulator